MLHLAELEVPNALPRPGRKLAVLDWDGDARANQCALDVCLDGSQSR